MPSVCRRLPENTSVRVYLRCVITSNSLSFSEATTDRARGGGGGGGGGIEGEGSDRAEHEDGERGTAEPEPRAYCFLSDSTDRGAPVALAFALADGLAFGGALAAFELLERAATGVVEELEGGASGVFEELDCGALILEGLECGTTGVFEGLEEDEEGVEELVERAGELGNVWRSRGGRRTGLAVGTYSSSAPSTTSCFAGLSVSSRDGLE